MTPLFRSSGLLALLLGLAVPVYAQSTTGQILNSGSSAPRIAFSLLEGGLPPGAIDSGANRTANPLFVDADGPDDRPGTLDDNLRLQPASPAIDAGDNAALPSEARDLGGNPRIFDGGSGTAIVDLGAYEYNAAAVGTEQAPDAPPAAYVLSDAYPNPFASRTQVQFSVQHARPVRVALYDALGREHRRLYEGTPVPGRLHTLQIDSRALPSGLYFVRLVGDGLSAARPVTLVR